MSTSPLSVEVFEDAVSDIFSHADKPLTDSDFDRLSDLLVLRDKREWALRPRTYAVLRLMNRLDVMGTFIHKGFNDFHIPYHVDRLSSIFRDSSSREEFTEKQILVMTKESGKAYDLERSQGRHRHLCQSCSRLSGAVLIINSVRCRQSFPCCQTSWSRRIWRG
jgi:hypothetical protein